MFRLAPLLALVVAGCSPPPKQSFSKLAEEFVYNSLALSPVAATQTGYHRHDGKQLDALLDDFSPGSIERQRRWYQDFRIRLMKSVDPAGLGPEDRADYDIIQGQISNVLLELTGIQNFRHNPTMYVELIGTALFSPYSLAYADLDTRYEHIIARLQAIPRLFEDARRNLISAPEIWTRVAIAENEGNASLIDEVLRPNAPAALRAKYDAAAAEALKAVRGFDSYLRNDLLHRGADWRLGETLYGQKFRYVLASDRRPREILADAEEAMRRTRQEMYKIAFPLYRQMFPGAQDTSVNRVITAVLGKISELHSTPESYFPDARRDLERHIQ